MIKNTPYNRTGSADGIRFFLILVIFIGVSMPSAAQRKNLDFNHLGPVDGLSQSSGHTILQDSRGYMWFGTNDGLNRYNGYSMTVFNHIPDDSTTISGGNISCLYEDSRNNLWIGTTGSGLNVFNRDRQTFRHFKVNYPDPGNGISDNSVTGILESEEGMLWIATYNGLNYLDPHTEEFTHFYADPNDPESLSSNYINTIYEDTKGNFWVGTDGGGLNRFNRETGDFYPIRHDPINTKSLTSDVVLALTNGKDGTIWVGYYNAGLSKYNPSTDEFIHYSPEREAPYTLCSNDIFALYQDPDNNIWAGTNGTGVCELNPATGEVNQYQAEEGVIRDIYVDSRDNFWLATYGGGLKMLDRNNKEVWNFYEGDNGLKSNVVLSIHEDQNNNFWIGTKEGGLHHFDRDSLIFTSYSEKDGLSDNEVKGILEDDEGNLWLSTNKGISKFNPDSASFFNYSVEDGLQANEFNTLAYYKDSDGFMYFGGINGFNRFHPDSIRRDRHNYPVIFTDFKLFNKETAIGEGSPLHKHIGQADKLVLSYTASVLTFEYAALNFNKNKGVRYAYKLEGFEDNWNNVGQRRAATYTNLDAGEYIFRVRSANSDGVWNPNEASVTLVITPPFWRTTWFYLLSFLLAAGIIYGGYRYRVRAVRQQNKLLAEKVSERTSQLDQKNKELKKTLEDLKTTRDELIKKAHKAGMADLAAGVLHNVGNILNSVNTSSSVIGETIQKSKLKNFKKANKMLRKHKDTPEEFIVNDPRGKDLLKYYLKLEEALDKEHQQIKAQVSRLKEKSNLITDVIDAQQNYAKVGRINEKVAIGKVTKDALKLQSASIRRHGIEIIEEYNDTAEVSLQKSKFIHILINLLKNAKEAMEEQVRGQKKIKVRTWEDEEKVYLSVADNGAGIHKENLTNIFNHGFTTKEDGHGFGLHSSANYMSEMEGNIEVISEGKGKGTKFVLSFLR